MKDAIDAIIIGGGHNGLTAACYLARAGRKVVVLESSPTYGGMTSTQPVIEGAPQHRINEGGMDVTLLQATNIAQELELHKHGFELLPNDPPYAFLSPEGDSLCIWRDPLRTADEIRHYSAKDASSFLDFANDMDAMMNIVVPYMKAHPTRVNIGPMILGAARTLLHARRFKGMSRFMSASQGEYIEEKFDSPMVRSMLEAICPFLPVYQQGTAWLLVQFGFLHRFGVARVKTGTGGLTDALGRALLAKGGEIRTNAKVQQVRVAGGKVLGVRLDTGEEIDAPVVITGCNVKYALNELVPAEALSDVERKQARHIPIVQDGASSMKIDVALNRQVDLSRFERRRKVPVPLRKCGLVWHTYEDHVRAWDACARGEVPDPLTYFTLLPAANDPTQAPSGQETVWIWSGIAPIKTPQPWREIKHAVADRALAQADTFLSGLLDGEIGRRVMSPEDLAERFTVPHGNVYHVDIGISRFGPFRPSPAFADFTTSIKGLYLSGGGMHPSSGICGVPGYVAAKTALRLSF